MTALTPDWWNKAGRAMLPPNQYGSFPSPTLSSSADHSSPVLLWVSGFILQKPVCSVCLLSQALTGFHSFTAMSVKSKCDFQRYFLPWGVVSAALSSALSLDAHTVLSVDVTQVPCSVIPGTRSSLRCLHCCRNDWWTLFSRVYYKDSARDHYSIISCSSQA